MASFLCTLWPLLLAGLIGWLLCGLMARSLLRGRAIGAVAAAAPAERVIEKVVEKRVPDTAALAERDQQIANLRALLGNVEQMRQQDLAVRDPQIANLRRLLGEVEQMRTEQLAQRDALLHKHGLAIEVPIDIEAARRAGVVVKGADDLEIIEGIGPKIAALMRGAGIHTFAQLARTATARLQEILDAAGPTFRVANPGTWAEQAALCAANRWAEFKVLTDELVAGVRVGTDGKAS
jgi:predicted flap endonuclease-1-like 5' DNA nuclease